jgi:hypothetical protein
MSTLFIMSAFVCLWVAVYPRELADTLFFKGRPKVDVFAGILSWIYVCGFSYTVGWLLF